jgi:hypothetical protein
MKNIQILIILLTLCPLSGFSQNDFSFDKEKWLNDTADSLTTSYRGKITDDSRFFEMLKGKTKKQLIGLLSKPDCIDKIGFTTKWTVGYVYCIDKTTIDNCCKKCSKKCNPCKRSSVTLIVTNGFVVDIIGVHAGG